MRARPGSAYRGDFSTVVVSALNARNFSITGQDTPRAAYNHLRFGVTLGGPLAIPHLFHTNNGNFFVAYQLIRNRNANNNSPTEMPTTALRNGDLSSLVNAQGLPATVIDPLNGLPFPGNVIPQNRISPQAAALLNFYPLPNFDPTARYNYQVALIGSTSSDAMQSRLNKMINPRNFVNGTFAFQRTTTESPNVFAFRDNNHSLGINTNVTWRHTFTKMVNGTLTANFNRLSAHNTPFFANLTNVSGAAGIAGNNQDAVNWGPPNLNFGSGFASLNDSEYSSTRNQQGGLSYNMRG